MPPIYGTPINDVTVPFDEKLPGADLCLDGSPPGDGSGHTFHLKNPWVDPIIFRYFSIKMNGYVGYDIHPCVSLILDIPYQFIHGYPIYFRAPDENLFYQQTQLDSKKIPGKTRWKITGDGTIRGPDQVATHWTSRGIVIPALLWHRLPPGARWSLAGIFRPVDPPVLSVCVSGVPNFFRWNPIFQFQQKSLTCFLRTKKRNPKMFAGIKPVLSIYCSWNLNRCLCCSNPKVLWLLALNPLTHHAKSKSELK